MVGSALLLQLLEFADESAAVGEPLLDLRTPVHDIAVDQLDLGLFHRDLVFAVELLGLGQRLVDERLVVASSVEVVHADLQLTERNTERVGQHDQCRRCDFNEVEGAADRNVDPILAGLVSGDAVDVLQPFDLTHAEALAKVEVDGVRRQEVVDLDELAHGLVLSVRIVIISQMAETRLRFHKI